MTAQAHTVGNNGGNRIGVGTLVAVLVGLVFAGGIWLASYIANAPAREQNAAYGTCMEGAAKINEKLFPAATVSNGQVPKDELTRLGAGHFRCVMVFHTHFAKQIITDRYTMDVQLGKPGQVMLEKLEHLKVESEPAAS